MLFSLLNLKPEFAHKKLRVSFSSVINTSIMSKTFYLEWVLTTPWQHLKLLAYGSFTWRASWQNIFIYLNFKDDEKTNNLTHEVINTWSTPWSIAQNTFFCQISPGKTSVPMRLFECVILNILTASFPWVKWLVYYN